MDDHDELQTMDDGINKDFINHSLINQISEMSMKIARREAIITEQQSEIQELKKELEELRKQQIDEMDSSD